MPFNSLSLAQVLWAKAGAQDVKFWKRKHVQWNEIIWRLFSLEIKAAYHAPCMHQWEGEPIICRAVVCHSLGITFATLNRLITIGAHPRYVSSMDYVQGSYVVLEGSVYNDMFILDGHSCKQFGLNFEVPLVVRSYSINMSSQRRDINWQRFMWLRKSWLSRMDAHVMAMGVMRQPLPMSAMLMMHHKVENDLHNTHQDWKLSAPTGLDLGRKLKVPPGFKYEIIDEKSTTETTHETVKDELLSTAINTNTNVFTYNNKFIINSDDNVDNGGDSGHDDDVLGLRNLHQTLYMSLMISEMASEDLHNTDKMFMTDNDNDEFIDFE